jgi:hypothetical protein
MKERIVNIDAHVCFPNPRIYARLLLVSLAVLCLGACDSDSVVGVRGDEVTHSIVVNRGQEIDIKLGNVGPATYASPPSISSDVVSYLGVEVVPPNTPAGLTQLFRFRAGASGMAVVTFERMLQDSVVSTVQDTVQVR